ncbi:unnamed protein product [Penicillium glandicola]
MASTDQIHTSLPSIFRPRVRDGMIVVRRSANIDETAIFWAGTYFFPRGTNEAIGMDYSAFLADLEAHLQYDPELDEIQFQVPSPYRRIPLDHSLHGTNNIQDLQPEIGIVRTYNQWLAALAAMQTSRLMRESNIEYVLRDGVQPVAAAQFFIVRIAGILSPVNPTKTRVFVSDDSILDAGDSNQEGDDNGQV